MFTVQEQTAWLHHGVILGGANIGIHSFKASFLLFLTVTGEESLKTSQDSRFCSLIKAMRTLCRRPQRTFMARAAQRMDECFQAAFPPFFFKCLWSCRLCCRWCMMRATTSWPCPNTMDTPAH